MSYINRSIWALDKFLITSWCQLFDERNIGSLVTYRSAQEYENGKPVGTAMIGMYCDEPRSVSLFHKLKYDEVWHFYGGDPLRLVLLYPNGTSRDVVMGSDPFKGQLAQFVIPAGVWQAGHMLAGGRYSLFGCTVAPGFTGRISSRAARAKHF